MKIAVLFDANLNNRKGLFNAVINRTKYLISIPDCEVDVYSLQARPAGLNKLVKRQQEHIFKDILDIDGIKVHIIWYKRYLLDDILTSHHHNSSFLFMMWAKRILSTFSPYDIITAHSARCGEVARLASRRFNVPFFVTWHGTDIHTSPFLSKSFMGFTTEILRSANLNFFVSEALRDKALSIVPCIKSEILYNGISDGFIKYDDHKRNIVRLQYGVDKCKTIAFVGNLVPIKNVCVLPEIFQIIKRNYQGNLSFWIVGDGFLRKQLECEMESRKICCHFLGNRPSSEMPDIMNCIDVLILPSVNEGLPLVTIEAISCGANVVGSCVGGIPEVIGMSNAFDLDSEFVTNISNRILYMLTNNVVQTVSERFNWNLTAIKEQNIYNNTLSI